MEGEFWYGIWQMLKMAWNGMEDLKNGMEDRFPYFHTDYIGLYI